MNRIILVLFGSFLMNLAGTNAQEINLEWVKTMGGSERDYGRDIVVDKDNNIYVTGGFMNKADFDPSTEKFILESKQAKNVFIQKMDADGNLIWAKNMPNIYWGQGFTIDVDGAGNVYTAGTCRCFPDLKEEGSAHKYRSSTMFIQKMDKNGEVLWGYGFDTRGGANASGIDLDTLGNIYVAGSFMKTVSFDVNREMNDHKSNGRYDAFLMKLSTDGEFRWVNTWGGESEDYGTDVAVDSAGNAYVTGSFEESLDLDPGEGVQLRESRGGNDIFIQKFTPNGELIWAHTIGGNRFDHAESIALDPLGNVLIAGCFEKQVDFDPGAGVNYQSTFDHYNDWVESHDAFVLKLDSMGHHLWAHGFGGVYHENAFSVTSDSQGNVYTGGSFHRTVDFDPGPGNFNIRSKGNHEGFVQKLNADGEFQWAYSVGNYNWDFVRGLAVDTADNLLVTGYFRKKVDFDPHPNKSTFKRAKDFDVFVQKINQSQSQIDLLEPKTTLAANKLIDPKTENIELVVFPIPADDFVTVELPDLYQNITFELIDASGKVVRTHKDTFITDYTFDTKNLSPGVYVLKAYLDGVSVGTKVVVN